MTLDCRLCLHLTITVLAWHTVRTASESFFMSNKESRSINEQIALLKGRGMKIDDELEAYHLLAMSVTIA